MRQRLADRSEAELRSMLGTPDDYTEAALAMARDELVLRGLDELVQESAELEPKAALEEPVGIGGWLLLPLIGLLLSIVDYSRLFLSQLAILDQLANHPQQGASLLTLLQGHFAAKGMALAIAASVLFVLFVRRHHLVPRLMILWFAVLFSLASLEFVVIGWLNRFRPQHGHFQFPLGRNLVARSLLTAALWIPYFTHSRRVKNTFSRRLARGEEVSQEEVSAD